jgi:carboxylesterase
MTAPIMEGAEPFSGAGGPHGVLCCHGFTGNPNSMRPLGQALHGAGFAVEVPLWPGHGTSIDDMLQTGWPDWSSAAEAAYQELAGRSEKVVVAGLSMGGTLAAWLGANHPEIAGLILVNPATEPMPQEAVDMIRAMLDAGEEISPAIGSDIADPDVTELAYEGTPLRPLLSLIEHQTELEALLPQIACPVLLMTSPNDHVVAPTASDYLAARVAGPVERVTLERSYHVATLDYDRALIEERAVEFARRVTSG